MIVINPIMEAFLAVRFLSATESSVVIDKNMGIIPKGFMSVKNEVKHKSPYVVNSDMILFFDDTPFLPSNYCNNNNNCINSLFLNCFIRRVSL